MDSTTVQTILNDLRDTVRSGIPRPPSWWLDRGTELLALKQDLNDDLARWKTAYLARKMEFLVEYKSAEKAKIAADATPEYANYYKCELQGEDVSEFIRLCKLRTQLHDYDV